MKTPKKFIPSNKDSKGKIEKLLSDAKELEIYKQRVNLQRMNANIMDYANSHGYSSGLHDYITETHLKFYTMNNVEHIKEVLDLEERILNYEKALEEERLDRGFIRGQYDNFPWSKFIKNTFIGCGIAPLLGIGKFAHLGGYYSAKLAAKFLSKTEVKDLDSMIVAATDNLYILGAYLLGMTVQATGLACLASSLGAPQGTSLSVLCGNLSAVAIYFWTETAIYYFFKNYKQEIKRFFKHRKFKKKRERIEELREESKNLETDAKKIIIDIKEYCYSLNDINLK